MVLLEEERSRYARQLILPEVGEAGQERLRAGRVLICGLGGLGSPMAYYLAAAGVGTIGLVDGDNVEISNLQRQILHATADIGRAKTDSARERLQALNPHVRLETYKERLDPNNIKSVINNYDIILDGLDNFPSRLMVNRACLEAKKVFIHGGVQGFSGQIMTIVPGQGPCLQCLLPQEPPVVQAYTKTGEQNNPERDNLCMTDTQRYPEREILGVLGVLPGIIGSLQATEALKFLLGTGDLPAGRLLSYNALESRFVTIKVNRNPRCPACGG
ncbi:MAG: HesA/MoeB/ThiF family protein [Peptococcaceae bacterium]|nr:HesA/MoeB/ThiF family protein [Peptococcaceae bacterium]